MDGECKNSLYLIFVLIIFECKGPQGTCSCSLYLSISMFKQFNKIGDGTFNPEHIIKDAMEVGDNWNQTWEKKKKKMYISKPDTCFDATILMSKVSDCISCFPNNTIDCSGVINTLMSLQQFHEMGQSSSIYY